MLVAKVSGASIVALKTIPVENPENIPSPAPTNGINVTKLL